MDLKRIFNSVLWGSMFVAGGTLWLLDSLGLIDFNIRQWWPVIFIVIGVSIIADGVIRGTREK